MDRLRGDTDLLDSLDGARSGGPDRGADLAELIESCAQVEFADALQRQALAGSAASILEADENASFHHGLAVFVPRLRGVVALLEGASDEAAARREDALVIAARAGAPPEHARSAADLARALAVRDADGDRIRARRLLERALPELRVHYPGDVSVRAEKLSAFLEDEPH